MERNANELKKQNFPSFSMKDWGETANASLKNRTIDSLEKNTYENIMLKPLYTKEDLEMNNLDQYPFSGSNTRGFHPFGYQQRKWKITQKLFKSKWEELHPILSSAIQWGQNVLSFDIDKLENVKQVDFSNINELDLSKTPIFLLTKTNFKNIISKLLELPSKGNVTGFAGTDLVSKGIDKGEILVPTSKEFSEWVDLIKRADTDINRLKTICIDLTPYHNGGANAVQEIAIALSEITFYVERLKVEGWQPGKVAGKIVFHFPIGGNFFMEIAKLRAFRRLWSTFGNAYELTAEEQILTVSAETSSLNKSVLDPYVNLLRTGNEAFAAVLGGVDFLHISAFDETFNESNEFSTRLSRNIHLLLGEEALLNKVCDPAGGSYYIETLTNELVRKAWKLFQLIDAKGGILSVLQSGWLQKEITEIMEQRQEDIATRKRSLIGTNVYANLSEELEFPETSHNDTLNKVLALIPKRLSQPFENLRKQTEMLKKGNFTPTAGLICLGKLKNHKGRADFATGFLAAGGIHSKWSNECENIVEIEEFIKKTNYPYYCICGNDDSYERLAKKIAQLFKEKYINIVVDIAGRFPNEKWIRMKENGISGSIYMNQNLIEKHTNLLKLWEVK
ncbi:methylmalonyl-CoA mutase [Heyndrickxia sporothermodurans]|nr:methylmalonyl-CoA mutase [Heyndrickxia sporothermodurans]